MRIQLVSHYYPPEIGAPQARLSELAERWVERGHDVTVLTGMPNHPTGVLPVEYRGVVSRRERIAGVCVVRCWLYATPNEGFLKRTLGHLSFMITVVVLGMPRSRRPDVVVVSSPTFFSIPAAWLIARLRGSKFVIEVRDLWPALLVDLGVLTNRWAIRVLESLELRMYRAADRVVVVTEGFRQNLVERGVPDQKIVTIRNGVDLDRFHPSLEPDSDTRARLGVRPDQTSALYIGAHGMSQGLTTLVEAAALLDDDSLHLTFVGEGADKPRVAQRIADLGLTNVTMLPGVPRSQVPGLVASADVCLVPLRDIDLFRTFLPSKMFEFLAAGRAVVGSVRGECAEVLAEAGAVVVPPEDPEALAQVLRELAQDPERRKRMGEQGRAYVATTANRQVLADAYLDLLLSVGGQR